MQVQDDLKNFSQEQLIKEIQRPSGMAPQFLVLSEINRRQRVKQDVNARMAQQQPTVAEEAIASAGVPQGGLAEMSQALAPKSASALSTGVGTSMPMAMQSGGFLKTPDEIEEELEMMSDPDSMDFSRMSLEEMAEFAKKMKGLSQPSTMYGGGPTYMQEGGTLGLRQNNPGNIRSGAGFFGETGVGSGYATFQNPLFGGRALARLLSTYKNQYGISNVDSLVDRYAPSGDNSPESRSNYKGFMANKLGISKNDEIDLDDDNTKLAVMKAIVEFENKNQNPYSDQEYNLMIQSAKMDDEDKVSDLLTNREVIKDNAGGLDLISSAVASENLKSMLPQGRNLAARLGVTDAEIDKYIKETKPAAIAAAERYVPPIPRSLESILVRGGQRSIVDDPLEFEMGLEGIDLDKEDLKTIAKKKEKFGSTMQANIAASNVAEKLAEAKEKEKEEKDKKEEDDKKKTEPAVSLDDIINRLGSTPKATTNLEQNILDLQEQLKKDRQVDKYLAIARTGLAIADPTKTLSEAAEVGLDAFQEGNKRYTDGIIDIINARAKLAGKKTGLTVNELFNQLAKNRRDQIAAAATFDDRSAEIIEKLKDEEQNLIALIAANPGYAQFGIDLQKYKTKLADNQKED
jgi:hypothetical protein